MPKSRSYRLLCPISRALDRLGDKWVLLILRDLHAGPARFGELQSSLPGLASNLLTTRLDRLQSDGLIVHRSIGAAMVYELTELGHQTGSVLFELARFGTGLPHPQEVRRPGNLRTVVITLREALSRVVTEADELNLELHIDDEQFHLDIHGGRVHVGYGGAAHAPDALSTSYDAMIALADGALPPDVFAADHLSLLRGNPEAATRLLDLMGRGFAA